MQTLPKLHSCWFWASQAEKDFNSSESLPKVASLTPEKCYFYWGPKVIGYEEIDALQSGFPFILAKQMSSGLSVPCETVQTDINVIHKIIISTQIYCKSAKWFKWAKPIRFEQSDWQMYG